VGLQAAEHPRFFSAISQLWGSTFARPDPPAPCYHDHPFPTPDPTRGFMYMDRVGFRVPETVSELHRKGKRPLQRSLTPHLDCCPSAMFDSGG
jgi:hypothetical protein